MNSAVINIKTDPKVKLKAQKVASDLGLSLSALINGYLKQVIKTETVSFSLKREEKPKKWLLEAVAEARKEIRRGDVSPEFDNASDAIAYLDRVGA